MGRKKCYSKRNETYLMEHKHSFVGFFTAGYPNTEQFYDTIKEAQMNGMGIFEIGFPSENPYADGELIKESHKQIDHKISTDISFWKKLREMIENPIWIMGYKEDLIDTGIYKILAKEKVMDAIVIPIMDIEERTKLLEELKEYEVDLLGFIGDRLEWENNYVACEQFPIIYQQLYSGPTGCVNNTDSYRRLLYSAKQSTNGYLFAGFGIGTVERAVGLLKDGFDGVIIGTAIIKKMNLSNQELMEFLSNLNRAVDEVK